MSDDQVCDTCDGGRICYVCGGSGSMKESNPHPSPYEIDTGTGKVPCSGCGGSGDCPACKGSGRKR